MTGPAEWATVMGAGLWMPGFADLAAWRRGEAQPDATAPNPRQRRRTSLLIRMVAEVAGQAVQQAGAAAGALPVVVGSAFGELGTTVEMLQELENGGEISPTRFQNSVHNSAVGHLSIANANRMASTSLAAGDQTVAMVLLESLTLLRDRGGDVLAVTADEPLPEPIAPNDVTTTVAAALVLRAGRVAATAIPGPQPLAYIGDLRQILDAAPASFRGVDGGRPCAAILPLLTAILDAAEAGTAAAEGGHGVRRVELSPTASARWSIAVAPALGARP